MDKILQYINNSLNHEPIAKEDIFEYVDNQIDYCMKKVLNPGASLETQHMYSSIYLFWKDIKKEVEKEL